MFQWRRFQFFDQDFVREEGTKDEPHGLIQKLDISCATSGRGNLVFGDTEGFVNLVDRNFKFSTFQVFQHGLLHVHQMKHTSFLIGVGHDEAPSKTRVPTLKIYDIEKTDRQGTPLLLRSVKVYNSKFPGANVTCLAAAEAMNYLAFGLDNGAVVLLRGDIVRDRYSKQILLAEAGSQPPVTGLGFAEHGKNTLLFVSTTNSVVSYHLSTPKGDLKEVLDEQGCEGGCATLSDHHDWVVGRPEAIYLYEADGRGPCFAFDGAKVSTTWFRGYCIVVSKDDTPSGDHLPRSVGAAPTTHQNDGPHDHVLNIYDLRNKFIAFAGNFPTIKHIVSEWGSVFVLTKNHTLYQLEERDTQTKLEMLFRKKLFSVAINLAHVQQYDPAAIADIFRKYGDHLLQKGDYDGAMGQYLRTIGRLEPSYVIRKFLDAQRIHNLTSYLQALHEKNLATADHTTLLLNCYTKLKDVKRLDDFIRTDTELHFDVETAIKVLRQAGYYNHALYLAKRHQDHDWVLKIQTGDLQHHEEALRYIGTLDFYEAESNLKKYGKQLVTRLPKETTALLKRLCTQYAPDRLDADPHPSAKAGSGMADSADADDAAVPGAASKTPAGDTAVGGPAVGEGGGFGALSLGPVTVTGLTQGLEKLMTNTSAQAAAIMRPDAVPAQGPRDDGAPDTGPASAQAPDVAPVPEPQAPPMTARPEEFIHIYVDQPSWLEEFLEFVVQDNPDASKLVYDTLLELHLRSEPAAAAERDSTPSPSDSEVRVPRDLRLEKALQLLKNPKAKYDIDHALVLCQMHGFRPGVLYLYEKLKLYHEIVQTYMDAGDSSMIIQSCKRYGDKDPGLWTQVLSYFAEREQDSLAEIGEILTLIERDNLVPPLIVVQILAKSNASLGVVKDYVVRRLHGESQSIGEDQRQIRHYLEETERMRTQIGELKTSAKIFQLSKCTLCSNPLDLPTIHFLCGHSFHQRCTGDSEGECPKCAPDNHRVLEITRKLEQNIGQHDQFFKRLEGSVDGFGTIAEYFGRGIFNKVTLVDASQGQGGSGSAYPGGGNGNSRAALADKEELERASLFS